jgi:hypothetical protein
MTEDILKQKFGQENHFQVPDGYFDKFMTDIMQQLPERETKAIEVNLSGTKRAWLRPMRRFAVAASLATVLFGAATYYTTTKVGHNDLAADSVMQTAKMEKGTDMKSVNCDDYYFDEMADYAMLDNSDIYAYLVEN